MATENANAAENGTELPAAAPRECLVRGVMLPQFLLNPDEYARVLPAAAALGEDELLPVNIDVRSAVATVVGALPRIMTYRDEAEKLYRFDVAHFDQLQLRTFAAGHAHVQLLAASARPEALAALSDSATKLRERIYHDAIALARRGLINANPIADFKTNVGYRKLALDLLGMVKLLRDSWEKIAFRTAIELSELEQAELFGRQLMDAVRTREEMAATVAQLQSQRQRSFTLFSRSYDQVRRAIIFLRWEHDDIDQICPSLFARRGGRRRK